MTREWHYGTGDRYSSVGLQIEDERIFGAEVCRVRCNNCTRRHDNCAENFGTCARANLLRSVHSFLTRLQKDLPTLRRPAEEVLSWPQVANHLMQYVQDKQPSNSYVKFTDIIIAPYSQEFMEPKSVMRRIQNGCENSSIAQSILHWFKPKAEPVLFEFNGFLGRDINKDFR